MTDRTFNATSHDTVRELLIGDEIARSAHERLELRFRFLKQVVGARKAKGWTQADLAREVGKQRSAISRLEAGEHDPTLGTMVAVCRALDLPLAVGGDQLVG